MKVEKALEELNIEMDIFLKGTNAKGIEKELASHDEEFKTVYTANMMAIKALEIIGDLEKVLPTIRTTQFEAYAYHKILELKEVENEIDN